MLYCYARCRTDLVKDMHSPQRVHVRHILFPSCYILAILKQLSTADDVTKYSGTAVFL